jgi:hypothetical protein
MHARARFLGAQKHKKAAERIDDANTKCVCSF